MSVNNMENEQISTQEWAKVFPKSTQVNLSLIK